MHCLNWCFAFVATRSAGRPCTMVHVHTRALLELEGAGSWRIGSGGGYLVASCATWPLLAGRPLRSALCTHAVPVARRSDRGDDEGERKVIEAKISALGKIIFFIFYYTSTNFSFTQINTSFKFLTLTKVSFGYIVYLLQFTCVRVD